MKRIVALLLTFIMICFTLAACGEDDNNGDNANGTANVFFVEYKNTKIELGAKAESVISALGAPSSKKEIGDCGGLGAQIKYTYPSIVIYTLKTADGETVDQVELLDDLVTSSKGVYIGNTKDDVIKSYGEPNNSSDTSLQYINGNKYLKFGLENGKVVSISLLRETK